MRGEERIAVGTLLFGPGERLVDLRILVEASAPGVPVRELADFDELAERRGDEGVLLVDADILPAEDVGYLRRFLARETEFQLTLVGEDSSRKVARSLLRLPRVQWLGWPPDLDDLKNLVAPARAAAPARGPAPSTRSQPAPVRARPPVAESATAAKPPSTRPAPAAGKDELDRIEAILDLPDQAENEAEPVPRGDSPAAPPSENVEQTPQPATEVAAPPAYFRDQVADLADIAQRIEGGLSTLRESERDATEAGSAEVDALTGDVARLVQFTRTLSYLSAAPPPGEQVFDLAELVETLVAGLPKKGPKIPRWLARSSGPLTVHSDRELLVQVFDALLFVAEKCSARGDIVRVQAAEAKEAGPRRSRVTIDFSAGPLAGLEPAQVIEPYALRRVLPELGPNALSAARGIVTGQGGRLELEKAGRGRLTWVLELPLAAEPVSGPAGGTERKRPATPESGGAGHASRGAADPFA